MFSTYDKDHSGSRCPRESGAGWWFDNCGSAFLNGLSTQSKENETNSDKFKRAFWRPCENCFVFLKRAEMKVRPAD